MLKCIFLHHTLDIANSHSHFLGSWTLELLKVIGLAITCALILFACEEPHATKQAPTAAINQSKK